MGGGGDRWALLQEELRRPAAVVAGVSSKVRVLLMDMEIGGERGKGTVATMYGRTGCGRSVRAKVSGWHPYLYVQAPGGWGNGGATLRASTVMLLEEKLKTRLMGTKLETSLHRLKLPALIVGIADHRGTDIMGYRPEGSEMRLLKISLATPQLVGPMRDCFQGYAVAESGTRSAGLTLVVQADGRPSSRASPCQTYNSNVDATLQFMSDLCISGCQWFLAPAASAVAAGRVDLELECGVGDLEWESSEGDVPPIRTLSFDIEVAGRRGEFPSADVADVPVIQISLWFMESAVGAKPPVLLSLLECAPIEGAEVVCFDDERRLLGAFAELVVAFDPDILTGYNINEFDLLFLQTRAKNLGVEAEFGAFSRSSYRGMSVERKVAESAQVGRQSKNRVTLTGRVVLDLLPWIRSEYTKEESYSLKNVSLKFLKGQTKDDLSFTEITPLWGEGPAQRKVIGVYCLKDAELVLLLIKATSTLYNLVERARVNHILPKTYIERGTMARFDGHLVPEANAQGYVIPYIPPPPFVPGKKGSYQGATVLPVVRGLHPNVAVLDFASLYPSIMMGYNLCFSTIVLNHSQPGLRLHGATHVEGSVFVASEVKRGVVPVILERLVAKRKQCKVEMEAAADDPFRYFLLDCRQNAIKVMCNSAYGYFGSEYARLGLKAIARAVTGLGRKHILEVKETVGRLFTVAKGYEGAAWVAGGDTDSVFVVMPIPAEMAKVEFEAVAEAFRMAEILADEVNASLRCRRPMKLEVEKVYSRLLLMLKKRYAGLKYKAGEPPGDKPPTVDIKGVECVRRDGCALIRRLVKDVLVQLVSSGRVEEAAAMVRARVQEMLTGTVDVADYVIRKNLRKDPMSCMEPLTANELSLIRGKSADNTRQLTYSEVDQAIRAGLVGKGVHSKVNLRWKQNLVQVRVAWKQRLADPGSAPVPGQPVEYVITLNGGSSVSSKAETPQAMASKGYPVDRLHYQNALKKTMEGIFAPIYEGRLTEPATAAAPAGKRRKVEMPVQGAAPSAALEERALHMVRELLWRDIRANKLRPSKEKTRAAVEQSPIFKAFQRAAAAEKPLPP